MEAAISAPMKLCPVCDGKVDRPRARYCGDKCRRKAEYKRLRPTIVAYYRAHRSEVKSYMTKWRADNPDKIKANWVKHSKKQAVRSKAWRQRNPERTKQLKRESAKRCPPTEGHKRWCAANREKINEYNRKWAARNRPKLLARTRKRQAQKLRATPKWLTEKHYEQMVKIYERAAKATELCGEPHQVDHLIPLQGKGVCGLHVPWNLHIIPAFANRWKHNKYKSEWKHWPLNHFQ